MEADDALSVLLEQRATKVHEQHLEMLHNMDVLRRNIKRVLDFLEQAAPALRAQMVERLTLHQLVMTTASVPQPPPYSGAVDISDGAVADAAHRVLQSEPLRQRLLAACRGEFPATVYQSLTEVSFALLVPLLHSMVRSVSALHVVGYEDRGGRSAAQLETLQLDYTAAINCLCEGSYRFPGAFADPARRHQHRGLVMDLENANDTLGALLSQQVHAAEASCDVVTTTGAEDGGEDLQEADAAANSPRRKRTRPDALLLPPLHCPVAPSASAAPTAVPVECNGDDSKRERVDLEASMVLIRGLQQSTTDLAYRIRSLAQL